MIHTADLHLKKDEAEYGFSVLREIASRVQSQGASLLLIAGDLFDSWEDLRALAGEVRRWAREDLPGDCTVLFLPGNHDTLVRGDAKGSSSSSGPGPDITAVDWEPLHLLAPPAGMETPWHLYEGEDCQVLGVPHGADLSGSASWELPPRVPGKPRILALHASVVGHVYLGLSEEDSDSSAADPELARICGADYAALGHIHRKDQFSEEGALWAYPGSAVVWRRGEEGDRQILTVDFPEPGADPSGAAPSGGLAPAVTPITLERAGRWREIFFHPGDCPLHRLTREKKEPAELWPETFGGLQPRDFVTLRWEGLFSRQAELQEWVHALESWGDSRFRRWENDTGRIILTGGLEEEPLMQDFLQAWRSKKDTVDSEVWRRARELAFEEMHRLYRDRGKEV